MSGFVTVRLISPIVNMTAQTLKGKKILVTGADGFIGSHLVERLIRDGADVRAFVLYNSLGSWGWLDRCAGDVAGRFEVVAGDIRDAEFVRRSVRGCDIVLHLAALIAIPYSYHAPSSYVETNVNGTLNVLQAATDFGVTKVVHTSTSEVYGSARYVPIDESHPLQAQSPYAATKIAADQMALSFHKSFGTPVAVLRPFNTFGPRQSARAVIPAVATQLISGARTLKLGNIKPTRDFTYVGETVAGFVACALADSTIGEVVNVGSAFEVSIKDTAMMIGAILGVDFEIEIASERLRPAASEVDRLFADTRKASALFDWPFAQLGVDGFRQGLEKTVAWLQEPTNLALYKPRVHSL